MVASAIAPTSALTDSHLSAMDQVSPVKAEVGAPQDAPETATACMPRAGRTASAVSGANQDSSGASPVTFAHLGRRHHAAPEEFQDAPAPANAMSAPKGRYRSADTGAKEGVPQVNKAKRYSPESAALEAALMGHFARQLWDLQATRIQMGNRIDAMTRDGLDAEWTDVARSINAHTGKAETAAKSQLERIAKKHFMADWVQAQPGIGLYGFALIMGCVGSLDRFTTYAKLWRYLGLDVVNGHKVKLQKGVKGSFSTRGRMTCYQISSSIVRVGKGHWRELYDRKKAEYGETRPDWTPMHRHNAAQHYAVKMLIRALWREWMRRVAA